MKISGILFYLLVSALFGSVLAGCSTLSSSTERAIYVRNNEFQNAYMNRALEEVIEELGIEIQAPAVGVSAAGGGGRPSNCIRAECMSIRDQFNIEEEYRIFFDLSEREILSVFISSLLDLGLSIRQMDGYVESGFKYYKNSIETRDSVDASLRSKVFVEVGFRNLDWDLDNEDENLTVISIYQLNERRMFGHWLPGREEDVSLAKAFFQQVCIQVEEKYNKDNCGILWY